MQNTNQSLNTLDICYPSEQLMIKLQNYSIKLFKYYVIMDAKLLRKTSQICSTWRGLSSMC